MLSRVADALFWMSRYVERAENVARFIDVNFHMILDGSTGQAEGWNTLVNTTGDHEDYEKRYQDATREKVVHFLTFDLDNPNSILSCVCSARENARTIRDVITSDMWEQMNSFYLMLRDPHAVQRVAETPYDFFSQVKQASQSFVGITDLTLSHGEAWNFCRVGRLLERTDKTTRLLDVKYYLLKTLQAAAEHDASQDVMQWSAVLKSASALEMYRKKYRKINSEGVVKFLLTDREFPRSALYCLNSADEAIHNITGTPRGSHRTPAERELGRLCADIAYTDVKEILDDELHVYLDSFQTKLNVIGEAIYETFFSLKTPKQSQIQSQSGQSQTQTMR
ncbi:MAG: alpha-E domain-containing protein [Planctomycetota bacterium]